MAAPVFEITLAPPTGLANAAKLQLTARELALALVRALNRTMAGVQTDTVRALAEDTGLRAKDIRPAMALRRATTASQVATLSVTGRRIPLIAFGARGPEPSRGKGAVTYRLGQTRKRLPHAFIATTRSGHRGVFRRVGRPRKPIIQLFGPSLPEVTRKRGLFGTQRAEARFARELQSQVTLALASR